MTKNNFICKVVQDLLDDQFSIIFHQQKDPESLGGSFDGTSKEFIVSIKSKLGFEVLVHEYCHYQQWKQSKRYYNRLIDAGHLVFDWIDGTFFKKDVLNYAFENIIELEWDCEKRAVETIKKYNLDVDIEKYIKTANTYLLFYHIVRENRKWCSNGIYSPSLVKSMPNEILDLDFYLDPNNIKEHQRKKYIKNLE